MTKTRRVSAAEWSERVSAWDRSGMTAAEFGRRHGYDGRQLTWWKWNLGRRARAGEKKGRSTGVSLLPARVVPARVPASDGLVEIVLGNGRTVRLRGEVEGRLAALAVRIAESA